MHSHSLLGSAWSSPLQSAEGGDRFALCFLRHVCSSNGARGVASLRVFKLQSCARTTPEVHVPQSHHTSHCTDVAGN